MSVRVAPVTEVCTALREWGKATGTHRWPTEFEAMKSNLLYRLVYLGEPVRTEKCPKHDGHWSGCNLSGGPGCDCQKVIVNGLVYYDSNVTGWLLDGNPAITGNCGCVTLIGRDGKRLDTPEGCTYLSGHEGACSNGVDWGRRD